MEESSAKEIGKLSVSMEYMKRDIAEISSNMKEVPRLINQSHDALQVGLKELANKMESHYVSKEEFEPISKNYVSHDQFDPVRKLVYGCVAIVLTAVVGAIIAFVITKSP